MFFRKTKKEFSYDKFIKKAARSNPFELGIYDEYVGYLRKNKSFADVKKLGLKLVVVSDTHGHFAFLEERFSDFMENVSEYDACVLLGDIHPYDLKEILKIVPKQKILAIRGNHDSFELYEKEGIREMSGRTVEIKGVTFAGVEGSFRYKDGIFPSFSQYESLYQLEDMKPADVLLTHDCMFEHSKNDIAHAGLVGITRFVYKYAPVWHIHGHLHSSYQKEYDNGTVEKCVYLCEYLEI